MRWLVFVWFVLFTSCSGYKWIRTYHFYESLQNKYDTYLYDRSREEFLKIDKLRKSNGGYEAEASKLDYEMFIDKKKNELCFLICNGHNVNKISNNHFEVFIPNENVIKFRYGHFEWETKWIRTAVCVFVIGGVLVYIINEIRTMPVQL